MGFLQDDLSVKANTRQHVLFKECDVLGVKPEVVVFLEVGLGRPLGVLARHDVPVGEVGYCEWVQIIGYIMVYQGVRLGYIRGYIRPRSTPWCAHWS